MPSLFAKYYRRKILLVLFLLSIVLNTLLGGFLLLQHLLKGPEVKSAAGVELLQKTWMFSGNKTLSDQRQTISPDVLSEYDALRITYNLQGVCILDGYASALVLQSKQKAYGVSLAKYGKNCFDGEQYATIPFSDFSDSLTHDSIESLSVRFWYPTTYEIEITSITAYKSVLGARTKRNGIPQLRKEKKSVLLPSPSTVLSPTITSQPLRTPTPTILTTSKSTTWSIQSVSSMKESKDRVCNPRSQTFIAQWVKTAKELGVNYIAVETPYDNPSCGDAVAYTKAWVQEIRAQGLSVWHRHMPLAFEGIYDTGKNNSTDYLPLISEYITSNSDFFRAGDIFTPVPEPQNGGISGVTYCPQDVCIFQSKEAFNAWLRNAIDASEAGFGQIGLGGKMKIGYYGFDGFVAWGDNNPDWDGILEAATVQKMGNITIDHYPEIVNDTMENDLNELQAKYPSIPIIIGEWGTITGGNTDEQVQRTMSAAKRSNVQGFNYWHMGVGGNEALITEGFSKNPHFTTVQKFFTGQ